MKIDKQIIFDIVFLIVILYLLNIDTSGLPQPIRVLFVSLVIVWIGFFLIRVVFGKK